MRVDIRRAGASVASPNSEASILYSIVTSIDGVFCVVYIARAGLCLERDRAVSFRSLISRRTLTGQAGQACAIYAAPRGLDPGGVFFPGMEDALHDNIAMRRFAGLERAMRRTRRQYTSFVTGSNSASR